jgi:hypothetical protein
MAKTEMKHVTCDNCGATVEFQVTLTGIGELDDYLKRGWAVIALPQEIAEQFEGRVITRGAMAEINSAMKARASIAAMTNEPAAREETAGTSRPDSGTSRPEHAVTIGRTGGSIPGFSVDCSCGHFHEWIQGSERRSRDKAQSAGINHVQRSQENSLDDGQEHREVYRDVLRDNGMSS